MPPEQLKIRKKNKLSGKNIPEKIKGVFL